MSCANALPIDVLSKVLECEWMFFGYCLELRTLKRHLVKRNKYKSTFKFLTFFKNYFEITIPVSHAQTQKVFF